MKRALLKLHWILAAQFGLDPIRLLRALRRTPSFLLDFMAFRRTFSGRIPVAPCLHDRFDEGGSTKSEYFWQVCLSRAGLTKQPRKSMSMSALGLMDSSRMSPGRAGAESQQAA